MLDLNLTLRWLTLVLTIATGAGCVNQTPESSRTTFHNTATTSFVARFSNARLDCGIASGCSSQIGLIAIRDDDGSFEQCTGFLIDENTMATAGHCVPQSLRTGFCSKDIKVRFVNDPKIYSCQKVIAVHGGKDELGPDYAFFDIEDTGREGFKIAKVGVPHNQALKLVKFTPLSTSEFGARMEKEDCTAKVGSFLSIEAFSPFSLSGVAVGCGVVPGDSGSPILNDKGEVVAITQAFQPESFKPLLEGFLASYQIKLPPQLPKHTIFTNLSCIDDPLGGLARGCEDAKRLSLGACLRYDYPSFWSSQDEKLSLWQQNLPKVFSYQLSGSEESAGFRAEPICVNESEFFMETARGIYDYRLNLIPEIALDGTLVPAPVSRSLEKGREKATYQIWKTGKFWLIEIAENTGQSFLGITKTESVLRAVKLPSCHNDRRSLREVMILGADGATYSLPDARIRAQANHQTAVEKGLCPGN